MLANEDLSESERRLIEAAESGTLLDLAKGQHINPARASTWKAAKVVRAEVMAELLTGIRKPASDRIRAIKLRGARITGYLDLEACKLLCRLQMQDCSIEQPINLQEASAPAIRLSGCHVPEINAERLRCSGNLELNARFTATGQIRLLDAHLGGLSLGGATLFNPGSVTLNADRLTVVGNMFCGDAFAATGEVRMLGAHIGGQLSFDGATLHNPGGDALNAERLGVDQGMCCRDGFTAAGQIRLVDAHISGQLLLDGAALSNPGDMALNADRLIVDGSMFCRDGFTATGQVRLLAVHVTRQLSFGGATLTNPGELALDLEAAQITHLTLCPAQKPDGTIDLRDAQVVVLDDEPRTWPTTLRLRGFTYQALHNDTISVRARLDWLRRHASGYTPQPYDQLAATYRRAGQDEDARKVAITKQWRRRSVLRPGGKLLNWLLYLTVGYGYRTWLAGLWLAVLTATGTWIFSRAHLTSSIAHPPPFVPLAYTLDVLLPIVDLGQEKAWHPTGTALYWMWALIAAGWIMTTAVVAGLTGVLKRN